MSYIGQPFAHDLFVTYSHGATVDGVARLKNYSQAFVRELESELRVHPKFGRDIKLFLDGSQRPDQGLDPMVGLTDQLREDVGGAALLMVLMSDHYLKSGWCTDERNWWVQKQAQLGLSHDERIALARIWPTTNDWPAVLCDERGSPFVGICFHNDERPQPFEWPAPDLNSKDPFRDLLLKLVGWLWRRIEQMKQRMDERQLAQQDAAKLADDTGQVLYLHGRVQQMEAWERANEALTAQGFTVFPGEPDSIDTDPRRAQDIRRDRIQTLSGCDALLLLGTEDGRALDADLVVIGRQDRQSARAISNRFLPCGLLDTVGQSLGTAARRQAARGLQVDWIDSTREPWTGEVQQWLTQKSAAAERSL